MSGLVEFPQPMVEAPEANSQYWVVCPSGAINDLLWDDDDCDHEYLKAGNAYATKAGAEQRVAYNAQEMARLVTPPWLRKLGADVEFQWAPGKWETVDLSGRDWSQEKPENYRAKVRDVVVNVNGVEYRWPPTAKQGDPRGPRFTAQVDFVSCEESSCLWGNRTHLTRAGCEAQNVMLIAALGGQK